MSSIKCPECNLTNWSTAISCKRCGYHFQPMENIPSAENVNPVENFAEYQPQAIADFQTPDDQFQQDWAQHRQYAQNRQYKTFQPKYVKQKSGLAITSLVLGLIGCFITSPIGLILGIISLVKIKRYPSEYGGKGMAIAGVVLNILGLISIPIIAAIAIPNLLAARRAANEGAAISSLRIIAQAENTYMATVGTRNCADLAQLGKSSMIDEVLAGGSKSGYRFVLTATANGCEIYATPINSKGAAATGTRSFYSASNEGWVIRSGIKNGLMADKNDLPLDTGALPKQTTQPPKIATQKSPF
jgi:type IV pilus assembly protein PilA